MVSKVFSVQLSGSNVSDARAASVASLNTHRDTLLKKWQLKCNYSIIKHNNILIIII